MLQPILFLLRHVENSIGLMGVGPSLQGFMPTPMPTANFQLVGTTKNEDDGTIIANVPVKLFETGTDLFIGQVTSDASGNFAFLTTQFPTMNYAKQYYCVAYLAGAPDFAGTTVNTLMVSAS